MELRNLEGALSEAVVEPREEDRWEGFTWTKKYISEPQQPRIIIFAFLSKKWSFFLKGKKNLLLVQVLFGSCQKKWEAYIYLMAFYFFWCVCVLNILDLSQKAEKRYVYVF
jgi:hypothetical protein